MLKPFNFYTIINQSVKIILDKY